MTRLFPLILTLLFFPISASAQGFWVGPDDDMGDISGGPPTMQGDLSGEAGLAEATGKENYRRAEADPFMTAFINWLAGATGGHIPVDPKCPPPDGCKGDDPADPPSGGGEGGDPPSGDDPPEGGDETPTEGGGESSNESSASESSAQPPPPPSGSGYTTFLMGRASEAMQLRDHIDPVAEGALVPGAGLPQGARLRLVSKREANQGEQGEYVLRFLIEPRRRGAAPIPLLVQAGDGYLFMRSERQRQRRTVPGRR